MHCITVESATVRLRIGTFTKGAFAGGVGAMVVMGATVALAGTGIGGVFNLGKTNTVNATSVLTGSEKGAGLSVTNTNTTAGSTPLSLNAAAGHAPFAVSNTAQVAHLNSTFLEGYARTWLNRVGIASNESLVGLNSTETDGTATITAPVAGFVKVQATFVAEDAFSSSLCSRCLVEARLHDEGAGTDSPMSVVTLGTGAAADYASSSLQWVFPAKGGSHSYSLTTVQYDTGGPAQIDNPIVTAQFIPFGSTGSATQLAGAISQSPGHVVGAPATR
jgi:hypothetical protein